MPPWTLLPVTSVPDLLDEFVAIERLFRPLAADAPEARGLRDDVAVLPGRPGHDLVLTTDAMIEGVHFLADDPRDLVARKVLRSNLSDLAAKGSDPFAYLLSVSWSRRCSAADRVAFAAGLAEDQERFGVRLFGGDTTSTPGPLTVTIMALGWVPQGRTVSRSGAQPGDLVLVSGSIGDGWLGLQARLGNLNGLEPERVEALIRRYRIPEPRTGLSRAVRDHASASADVSDGLIADLAHIASASGVAAAVRLEAAPLSRAARSWLGNRADPVLALSDLATGGDDYEIVCCARPEHARALVRAGELAGAPFTIIGDVTAGSGVSVTYEGAPVVLNKTGWRHAGGAG